MAWKNLPLPFLRKSYKTSARARGFSFLRCRMRLATRKFTETDSHCK